MYWHMPESNRHVGPDEDRLIAVLADPDRRAVIAVLAVAGEPLTVDELSERLLDETDGKRRLTRLSLHHSDLPKLARAGLVDYDPTDTRVTLSASGEQLAAEIERAAGTLHELATRTRQQG